MDEYFEKGYHIDRYHALEGDLLTFLDHVTLEFYPQQQDRVNIKSIYLADLMLRIGSNIGIFFDKFIESYMVSTESNFQKKLEEGKLEDFQKKSEKIANGKLKGWNWGDYKELEPVLNLSGQDVLLIPLNEKIYPFRINGKIESKSWKEINRNTEFWWNSYNKIKHNAAFKNANLDNVLQSLAALFLLITKSGLGQSNKLLRYNYYERDNRGGLNAFAVTTRLFSRNTWND